MLAHPKRRFPPDDANDLSSAGCCSVASRLIAYLALLEAVERSSRAAFEQKLNVDYDPAVR
jgi:hypothetical protein